MPHYTDQHRLAARGAYVYQRKNLEQISLLVSANQRTIAAWKKRARDEGDDWDKARTAASLSLQGRAAVEFQVFEDFLLVFQATIDEAKNDPLLKARDRADIIAKLTDSYHKMMAASAKASPQLNRLAIAMDVLHDFADFLRDHFPQHAAAFLEVLEPFGAYIGKKY